jgi:hypothetical protein
MATRNLLHKIHLEAFKEWLKNDGWAILDGARGLYEVIRAKKGDRWLIVYRKADAKEHYSVRDVDCGIVRNFLRRKKR